METNSLHFIKTLCVYNVAVSHQKEFMFYKGLVPFYFCWNKVDLKKSYFIFS